MVVAYMTDFDLVPKLPRNSDELWTAYLRPSLHTRSRMKASLRQGKVRIVSANSYRMDRVAAKNWLAVGDAAMAWDPLSGQGICKALESGLLAAETIIKVYGGDLAAAEQYQKYIDAQFSDYLRTYVKIYGAERRWLQSRFWQRRQQLTPANFNARCPPFPLVSPGEQETVHVARF
jgi:flavin-dependent dehydrogenase